MPHKDEYHDDNMLTRGQEIAVEVDEAKAVSMPLQPGEASLHNGRLAHASEPNRSDWIVPAHPNQTGGGRLGMQPWFAGRTVHSLSPRPSRDDPVKFHEKAATAVIGRRKGRRTISSRTLEYSLSWVDVSQTREAMREGRTRSATGVCLHT